MSNTANENAIWNRFTRWQRTHFIFQQNWFSIIRICLPFVRKQNARAHKTNEHNFDIVANIIVGMTLRMKSCLQLLILSLWLHWKTVYILTTGGISSVVCKQFGFRIKSVNEQRFNKCSITMLTLVNVHYAWYNSKKLLLMNSILPNEKPLTMPIRPIAFTHASNESTTKTPTMSGDLQSSPIKTDFQK